MCIRNWLMVYLCRLLAEPLMAVGLCQCVVDFFFLYLSTNMHVIHLKGECPNKSQNSAGVEMWKGYQGQQGKAKRWKKMQNNLISMNRLVDTALIRNWTRDFCFKMQVYDTIDNGNIFSSQWQINSWCLYACSNSLIDLSTTRKQ